VEVKCPSVAGKILEVASGPVFPMASGFSTTGLNRNKQAAMPNDRGADGLVAVENSALAGGLKNLRGCCLRGPWRCLRGRNWYGTPGGWVVGSGWCAPFDSPKRESRQPWPGAGCQNESGWPLRLTPGADLRLVLEAWMQRTERAGLAALISGHGKAVPWPGLRWAGQEGDHTLTGESLEDPVRWPAASSPRWGSTCTSLWQTAQKERWVVAISCSGSLVRPPPLNWCWPFCLPECAFKREVPTLPQGFASCKDPQGRCQR